VEVWGMVERRGSLFQINDIRNHRTLMPFRSLLRAEIGQMYRFIKIPQATPTTTETNRWKAISVMIGLIPPCFQLIYYLSIPKFLCDWLGGGGGGGGERTSSSSSSSSSLIDKEYA